MNTTPTQSDTAYRATGKMVFKYRKTSNGWVKAHPDGVNAYTTTQAKIDAANQNRQLGWTTKNWGDAPDWIML